MSSKAPMNVDRKYSAPARLPSNDIIPLSDSDSDEDDKPGQSWDDFSKEQETLPDKKIGEYVKKYLFNFFQFF